jgi:hypothetical protein
MLPLHHMQLPPGYRNGAGPARYRWPHRWPAAIGLRSSQRGLWTALHASRAATAVAADHLAGLNAEQTAAVRRAAQRSPPTHARCEASPGAALWLQPGLLWPPPGPPLWAGRVRRRRRQALRPQVVTHERAARVVAGPGSGKTRVVVGGGSAGARAERRAPRGQRRSARSAWLLDLPHAAPAAARPPGRWCACLALLQARPGWTPEPGQLSLESSDPAAAGGDAVRLPLPLPPPPPTSGGARAAAAGLGRAPLADSGERRPLPAPPARRSGLPGAPRCQPTPWASPRASPRGQSPGPAPQGSPPGQQGRGSSPLAALNTSPPPFFNPPPHPPPQVITFTNKAAGELKERLRGALGAEEARQLTAGTFHSLCHRWLRQHVQALAPAPGGYSSDFVIYDEQVGRAFGGERVGVWECKAAATAACPWRRAEGAALRAAPPWWPSKSVRADKAGRAAALSACLCRTRRARSRQPCWPSGWGPAPRRLTRRPRRHAR